MISRPLCIKESTEGKRSDVHEFTDNLPLIFGDFALFTLGISLTNLLHVGPGKKFCARNRCKSGDLWINPGVHRGNLALSMRLAGVDWS